MTDYSKVTAFTPKDSLASGDPSKLVVGAELDGEFDAIATMSATKENKASKGVGNGYAPLDANARVPIVNQHETTDYTDVSAVHTVGKSTAINTLTDAATITINCQASNVFLVTLGGNRTFGAPTNRLAGQVINLIIKQDATGSRTATWHADFKWPSGVAPVLSTAPSAVDMISMQYDTVANVYYCTSQKDFA